MQKNGRTGIEPSARPAEHAQPQNHTALSNGRQLLTQAITALSTGEQDRALESLNAAAEHLGTPHWAEESAGGRALDLTVQAIDHTVGGHLTGAKELAREAAQLTHAAQEVPAE